MKSSRQSVVQKVVNPSSCHAKRFSLLPTSIGNHMWHSSCAMTPAGWRPPQMVIIGYSMPPPMMPSHAVMCGHGYGCTRADMYSIVWRAYSAARVQSPEFGS